jgi:hypothetical protein
LQQSPETLLSHGKKKLPILVGKSSCFCLNRKSFGLTAASVPSESGKSGGDFYRLHNFSLSRTGHYEHITAAPPANIVPSTGNPLFFCIPNGKLAVDVSNSFASAATAAHFFFSDLSSIFFRR